MEEATDIVADDLSNREVGAHMRAESIKAAQSTIFTPKDHDPLTAELVGYNLPDLHFARLTEEVPTFVDDIPIVEHRLGLERLGRPVLFSSHSIGSKHR